jgi:hypothetical protein
MEGIHSGLGAEMLKDTMEEQGGRSYIIDDNLRLYGLIPGAPAQVDMPTGGFRDNNHVR